MENIGEVKQQLQALGLPISTPGLTGKERLDALSKKLQDHTNQLLQKRTNVENKSTLQEVSSKTSQISITELKTRSIQLSIKMY